MTEQIGDQISAFVDDELSVDESAFLLRRFESDAGARQRAVRYLTIGSALRGELAGGDVLRRRVAAALSGAAARAERAEPVRARPQRYAAGFGIAAAVAAVAIVGLRAWNDNPAAPDAGSPMFAGVPPEPPSYVVPQGVSGSRGVVPSPVFTSYLVRHGEFASGLSRAAVDSNLVALPEAEPLSDAAVAPGPRDAATAAHSDDRPAARE